MPLPKEIEKTATKYRTLSPVAASKQDALYVPPQSSMIPGHEEVHDNPRAPQSSMIPGHEEVHDNPRANLKLGDGLRGTQDDTSLPIHTEWANPNAVFREKGAKATATAGESRPGSPTPAGVDSALPRYKRVDNPDERAGGGFPGTSRIATRDGRLVDLSREGSALPSKAQGPENRFTGTPGFNNRDLVDLYGSGAVSAMSDEDWAAQVAKNSAVPSGWVRNPDARPGAPASEQFIRTGGDSAMPKLDYSNPTALLASAIPWAIKVGQNKAKRREDEQQRQLFKDKYGIDLQRMELGLKAPVYAGQAAHSQAEAKKAEAEAAAFRPKTRDGAILQKLIETTYSNMTLLHPDDQAAEMGKINKWWAQIDAIEGGGGAAPNQNRQAFNELPPAAQYAGKTTQDTQTGKKYRSDGKQWVEVS